MNHYSIAVIPGDGIGQEVCPEGIRVLNAAGRITGAYMLSYHHFPWGCEFYLQNGKMMDEDGLKRLVEFDAIYFGAVGYPTVPDHISLHGLRLPICQAFEQYANIRPSRLLPGIVSPLRDIKTGEIDFVVVRENSEGEYLGAGGKAHPGHPGEIAVDTSIFSRAGIERVMRYAFNLSTNRPQRKLSSVTKSNAQKNTLRLWDEIFEELAGDYPQVTSERVLVDAMAARFVLQPQSLDVVVASNLFADILTDLGGAICGSLGMAPSANLNPERVYPSMFEPIHGSAPDIVGKGIANPIAMIWSGAMMMEFLGEIEAAELILNSISAVTSESKYLTPDVGGGAITKEVTDAIIEKLKAIYFD